MKMFLSSSTNDDGIDYRCAKQQCASSRYCFSCVYLQWLVDWLFASIQLKHCALLSIQF
jgi:hypothetical protein